MAVSVSARPRLLDLFCGAGGASMGYHRAGFDVVGVDLHHQPRYPFQFVQADALTFTLDGFDAIHASPPCQRFSKSVDIADRAKHPDLIAATRDRLVTTGLPYVIENVPQAPLIDPVRICGSAFGPDVLQVARHRLFESNVPLAGLPCRHELYVPQYPPAWNRKNPLRFVAVSGGWQHLSLEERGRAMGIDWMKDTELSESIPPAYTEYVGRQLLSYISA